jgi:hypothetical protein
MISPHNLLDCRQLYINTSYLLLLLLLLTAGFHWGCLIRNRNSLLFARNWVHPQFILVGSVFLIFFVFCVMLLYVCLFVLFLAAFVSVLCRSCPMFPLPLDCPFLIASSVFSTLYFHAWMIGHYCAVRREHSTYEILIK